LAQLISQVHLSRPGSSLGSELSAGNAAHGRLTCLRRPGSRPPTIKFSLSEPGAAIGRVFEAKSRKMVARVGLLGRLWAQPCAEAAACD
jgi:hypothetical protein